MKTATTKFRIGDVAKQLDVKEFVIRFWEREFKIKAQRSTGGQRFYSQKDVTLLGKIKSLLYDNGYTIAGAKKYLKDMKQNSQSPKILAAKLDTSNHEQQVHAESKSPLNSDIFEQLAVLKGRLMKLRELL